MGDGGVALLSLPPETFARYQALRGNAPVRSAAETVQTIVVGVSGAAIPGARDQALSSYALRGIYFDPKHFSSLADCLTAASSHGLPLGLCR